MSRPLLFSATIKNGELFIYNYADFLKYLTDFTEGQKLAVTVTAPRKGKLRSLQANSYYWGVVLKLISEYTGEDMEDLHEVFKRRFLPYHEVVVGNERHKIAGSTAVLNTVQFYEYVERIRVWAAKFDIIIPSPNA